MLPPFRMSKPVSEQIANEKRTAAAIRLLWDYASPTDRTNPEFLCLLMRVSWVNGDHGPDEASRVWRNEYLAEWLELAPTVSDDELEKALVEQMQLPARSARRLVQSEFGFTHYYPPLRPALAAHVHRHKESVAAAFHLAAQHHPHPTQKVFAAVTRLVSIPRFRAPNGGRSSVLNAVTPALACLDAQQRFPVMNQRTERLLWALGHKFDADGARALGELIGTTGMPTAFHVDVYSQVYEDKFRPDRPRTKSTNAKAVRRAKKLTVGRVYTRADLKAIFTIKDATINNGVFPFPSRNEIWLFVTQNKTADRTQYKDTLSGDVLRWQGQTAGISDRMIIEHAQNGQRLLVFYRREKYEFDGAGFLFQGEFSYERHRGKRPTSFVLARTGPRPILPDDQGDDEPYNPEDEEDGRETILGAIRVRRGQQKFRALLLNAYQKKCAFSGCDVLNVLEAAHISPWMGPATNRVSNGFLLRADLHTLFDIGLITVETSQRTIVVDQTLMNSEYRIFHGRKVRRTVSAQQKASSAALDARKRMLDRA